jgi:hypothetical protein
VLIHPHKQGGLSLSLSIYLPANANLWRHLVRERRKMASRLVHFINGFPTWCCHNWVRVWLLTAYLVFCGVFVFVLLFSVLMLPFCGGWFARVDVCRYMSCDLLCSAIKMVYRFPVKPVTERILVIRPHCYTFFPCYDICRRVSVSFQINVSSMLKQDKMCTNKHSIGCA